MRKIILFSLVCSLINVFAETAETEIEDTLGKPAQAPMTVDEMRAWFSKYRQWMGTIAEETSTRGGVLQLFWSDIEKHRARWNSDAFQKLINETIGDNTEEANTVLYGLGQVLWFSRLGTDSRVGADILPGEDRVLLRQLLWKRIHARDPNARIYFVFGRAFLDEEIRDYADLIIQEQDDEHADRMLNGFRTTERLFVYDELDDAVRRRAERFPNRTEFHSNWRKAIAERRLNWLVRTFHDQEILGREVDEDERDQWTEKILDANIRYREADPEGWRIIIPRNLDLPVFRPYLIKWMSEEQASHRIIRILAELVQIGNPNDVPLFREYLHTLPIEEFQIRSLVAMMLARHGDRSDYKILREQHRELVEYAEEQNKYWNHVRGNERRLEDMQIRLGLPPEEPEMEVPEDPGQPSGSALHNRLR